MGEDNESRHNCCMHWIEKDGVSLPTRLGGHPALDLCNTWAGWGERTDVDDAKREWLPSYDVLAVWSGYADLVDEASVVALRAQAERHPRRTSAVRPARARPSPGSSTASCTAARRACARARTSAARRGCRSACARRATTLASSTRSA